MLSYPVLSCRPKLVHDTLIKYSKQCSINNLTLFSFFVSKLNVSSLLERYQQAFSANSLKKTAQFSK